MAYHVFQWRMNWKMYFKPKSITSFKSKHLLHWKRKALILLISLIFVSFIELINLKSFMYILLTIINLFNKASEKESLLCEKVKMDCVKRTLTSATKTECVVSNSSSHV